MFLGDFPYDLVVKELLRGVGSARPECLGKSYSRKKTGRPDGFDGMLLLSLEKRQLHVCISSQK
jgi:hypothetical protein